MEAIVLVVLLVLLLKARPKPSAADEGFFLPTLRMGAALLFAVLVGVVVVELF